MTITLEHIQELRKGITPGEWRVDVDWGQVEATKDSQTWVIEVTDDENEEITPNGQAISLVPELLEMAEKYLKLEARLTPSDETKKMFMGEFRFTSRSHTDELGEDVLVDQEVPWVAIKEIMKAISSGAEMKS